MKYLFTLLLLSSTAIFAKEKHSERIEEDYFYQEIEYTVVEFQANRFYDVDLLLIQKENFYEVYSIMSFDRNRDIQWIVNNYFPYPLKAATWFFPEYHFNESNYGIKNRD